MSRNVSRSELYKRVWQTPISRLAPELGLSDNGLRKLCLRNDIPVPARGYWARIAAGQAITQATLPRPEDDLTIALPSQQMDSPGTAGKRRAQPVKAALPSLPESTPVQEVEVRPTLDGCNLLVRNTERFFTKVAKEIEQFEKESARPRPSGALLLRFPPNYATQNGRYAPTDPRCLRIRATFRSISWILRFHDALIRALAVHGCKVQPSRSDPHVIEVSGSGVSLALSFAEDFETKAPADPRLPWAKEYIAKDTYRLKLGPPQSYAKIWRGDQAALTALLPMLARDIAAILAAEVGKRRVREAEAAERMAIAAKREEERRLQQAIQKRIAERKAARLAQVDRAMATAKAHDEFLTLRRLVSEVEARSAPEDEAVREWLTLVRPALVDPIECLLQEVRAEAAHDEKPLWWPLSFASDEPPDCPEAGREN